MHIARRPHRPAPARPLNLVRRPRPLPAVPPQAVPSLRRVVPRSVIGHAGPRRSSGWGLVAPRRLAWCDGRTARGCAVRTRRDDRSCQRPGSAVARLPGPGLAPAGPASCSSAACTPTEGTSRPGSAHAYCCRCSWDGSGACARSCGRTVATLRGRPRAGSQKPRVGSVHSPADSARRRLECP